MTTDDLTPVERDLLEKWDNDHTRVHESIEPVAAKRWRSRRAGFIEGMKEMRAALYRERLKEREVIISALMNWADAEAPTDTAGTIDMVRERIKKGQHNVDC